MAESADHPLVANWPTDVGDTPSLDGERVLWAVVLAVMSMDVLTTLVGLQQGLHEGNALVGAALAAFGPIGLLVIKAGVLVFAGTTATLLPDRVSPVVPLGLALPTTIAVAMNLTLVGIA